MQSNRSGLKLWVLGLVAILLLSLPLTANAQTTGGTSGSAGSGASASTPSAGTTNGIISPKDMAALSGVVQVRGYANSPDFMKWQLDLLPNGDSSTPIFLALGETPGEFTYSLDATALPAGEHALRLRVVRQDSNYDEYMTHFTIGMKETGAAGSSGAGTTASAAGTTAASSATTGGAATTSSGATGAASNAAGVTTNGLAAPREGQAISGAFVVRGFASDPDFMKWQLDLLPNGDPNSATFLALGETPGVFTYTLDTTNLPPGQHALRLRVVRNDSNYTEYTTNFTIGGSGAAGATSGPSTSGTGTTNAGGSSASGTSSNSGTSTTGQAGQSGVGVTTNGLAAPTEGETIKGNFVVHGYASPMDFMKWQLDLLPNGNADATTFLALGETPGEFTYTLDTTGLPPGEHALRLRVVRSDSNYDEYVTRFKIAQ